MSSHGKFAWGSNGFAWPNKKPCSTCGRCPECGFYSYVHNDTYLWINGTESSSGNLNNLKEESDANS